MNTWNKHEISSEGSARIGAVGFWRRWFLTVKEKYWLFQLLVLNPDPYPQRKYTIYIYIHRLLITHAIYRWFPSKPHLEQDFQLPCLTSEKLRGAAGVISGYNHGIETPRPLEILGWKNSGHIFTHCWNCTSKYQFFWVCLKIGHPF